MSIGTSTSTSTSTGASKGASTSTSTGETPGDPGHTASNTLATPRASQTRMNQNNSTPYGGTRNATGAVTGPAAAAMAGATSGLGTAPAHHEDVYPAISSTALADSMRGRVILISGADRGIGRSIALSFARAGAAGIALLSRTYSELISLASEISHQYPDTKTIVCAAETTDRVRLISVFSDIKRTLGIVDVLVVDAGVHLFRPFSNTPEEEWWHIMESNVRGPMMLARLALPDMRGKGIGTIIFISSRLGVESAGE